MRKNALHSYYSVTVIALVFMLGIMMGPVKTQAQSCHAAYTFTTSNLTVSFKDSSTSANFHRRLWLFGDGTKSDAKNPVHTFSASGSYRVCLIIKDTVNYCMDTFCETVKVQAACESNFGFSISGKTVTFTADTSHNKNTAKYIWKMGDGNFKTGKHFSYTYTHEGQYEACLTVSDSPCISKKCKLVVIGCHAKFTFKTDSTGVQFADLSVTSSGHYTRLWTFGDGKKSDAKNPYHTYDSAGSYRVCLIIKDTITKCSDTFCETVVIKNTNCRSNFTYSVSGNTVTFTADTAHQKSTVKYFWKLGNGTSKTGKHFSYTYSADGKYEVCLAVLDSPCEARTCKLVVISNKYRISGNIDADRDPAYPGTVWLIVFKASDSVLKAVKDTKITKDSTGTHYVFEGVEPGTYYVKAALDTTSTKYKTYMPTYFENAIKWGKADKIVVSNANLTGRNIHMVKGTNPGGKGFISGKISQGANKKEGDPVSDIEILLLTETGNPVSYTYSDINGEYSFSNLAWGTYQVYAEVAGLQTFPALVTISETNQSITGVGLKMNTTNIVTAVKPVYLPADNGISIYPNPVAGVLNIELDKATVQPMEITIYSITGKKILQVTKTASETIQLPVNELANGMYVLEVKAQKSQTIMRTRFIKAF